MSALVRFLINHRGDCMEYHNGICNCGLAEAAKEFDDLRKWVDEKDSCIDALRSEIERLKAEREILLKIREYSEIAVSQIICISGDEICQPCQNREKLAMALYDFKNLPQPPEEK